MRVQMALSPLVSIPLTLTAGAIVAASSWVALHHYYPSIPLVIYDLLTRHPWLTGVWIFLSIVGLDASLTSARDAVTYGNVGQKARAHWHLSGGQKK